MKRADERAPEAQAHPESRPLDPQVRPAKGTPTPSRPPSPRPSWPRPVSRNSRTGSPGHLGLLSPGNARPERLAPEGERPVCPLARNLSRKRFVLSAFGENRRASAALPALAGQASRPRATSAALPGLLPETGWNPLPDRLRIRLVPEPSFETGPPTGRSRNVHLAITRSREIPDLAGGSRGRVGKAKPGHRPGLDPFRLCGEACLRPRILSCLPFLAAPGKDSCLQTNRIFPNRSRRRPASPSRDSVDS